jgi:hypothetical protein
MSMRRIATMLVAVPTAALLVGGVAAAQSTGTPVDRPSSFTSTFTVQADPNQVPEQDGERGTPGASGTFDLQLNSRDEIICFDITLRGVNPPFDSPAPTATHIHQGPAGEAGPPVVLFPNPEMDSNGDLRSQGCLERPFVEDTFSLAQIEANPTAFYVDTHTEESMRGAVRGQLGAASAPAGAPATGEGGIATDRTAAIAAAILLLVLAAGAVGSQVVVTGARSRR